MAYPSKPLYPYKLNTNKNEASGASVQPIYMVKRSIDSSFCELSGAICFVMELTRAEILWIIWGPLVAHSLYGAMSVVLCKEQKERQ